MARLPKSGMVVFGAIVKKPQFAAPLSAAAGRPRYTDAEPLYQRTLAIREKALGPEHHENRDPQSTTRRRRTRETKLALGIADPRLRPPSPIKNSRKANAFQRPAATANFPVLRVV